MSRDLRLHRTPVDVLNYEILQEQAAALGRMGRALGAALAKLREFDAAHPRAGAPVSAQPARRTLVIEAGHALWMFVVQGSEPERLADKSRIPLDSSAHRILWNRAHNDKRDTALRLVLLHRLNEPDAVEHRHHKVGAVSGCRSNRF